MIIDIPAMTGETPLLPEHLIDNSAATLAHNCDFIRAVISPVAQDKDTHRNFGFNPATIWRWRDDFWFAFRSHVDIIRSPVALDAYGRVYWTDGQFPKYTKADVATHGSGTFPAYSYRLGIPAPTHPISVTVTDTKHFTKSVIPPKLPPEPKTADQTVAQFLDSNDGLTQIVGKIFENKLRTSATSAHDAWEKVVAEIKAQPPVYEEAKPDPTEEISRFYTETWVSDLGEEGAPGPPSAEVTLLWPDSLVTLTLQPPGAQSSSISRRRIYRTAAGGGTASYLLVAELPISQSSFTDSTPDSALTAPLETEHYLPPPDKLQGLCLMANGIAAGFVENTVCFSAAYLPYAWPKSYQLTTTADIVAIAPIGTALVVTTQKEPWIFSGVSPGAITGQRLPVIAPCASRDSMVVMGDTVIYAAPQGLIAVQGSGNAALATENLFTPEQWAACHPEKMRAWQSNGEYCAYNGSETLIFSPKTGTIRRTDSAPDAVYSDPERNAVYYTKGNQLYQIAAGNVSNFRWRSKVYTTPAASSFACIRIQSPQPVRTGARIFADGQLVTDLPPGALPDGLARLPARNATRWQVEVYGSAPVERITLTSTAQEMPA